MSATATLSSGEPAHVAAATVLLVDDNAAFRDMTEMALSSLGYSVQPCGSPEEAAAMAAASPLLKLLITDVIMAHTNGVQLAAAIQQVRPDMKVLFCSGYPAAALLRQGLDLAAGEFLMKPVTLKALSEKIEMLLAPERRAA